ncbi:trehalose-phosphatase [Ideonella sp. A 288]|uniref:trehalose-phosphatase n=1 Tax=Ideonella sp. A 288 TaxID=1962181 RepID=UPI001F3A67EA|nr:trehalose-phosphatase [Ideonella sp. A 288]
MQHIFSAAGQAALAAVLRRRPLLAFDFDGTLAPIVARPHDARAPLAVATQMAALGRHLPVAIVTGRSVDDVRGRLGFEPHFIVGNHGADTGHDADPAGAREHALDRLREAIVLSDAALAAAGVLVEDKGLSIALHYRLSPDRPAALALIHELTSRYGHGLRQFSGKMVENVVASDAPDKADAVWALMARCAAPCVFFAGDDVNDEPVFAAAPPDWLTLRVGRDSTASSAHFVLDSPASMAVLLQRMAGLLDTAGPARRSLEPGHPRGD